jgi:hypothetical protein
MPLFMVLKQPQPDRRSSMSPILMIVIKCLAMGIKYLNVCAYFFLSLRIAERNVVPITLLETKPKPNLQVV